MRSASNALGAARLEELAGEELLAGVQEAEVVWDRMGLELPNGSLVGGEIGPVVEGWSGFARFHNWGAHLVTTSWVSRT